MKVSPRIWNGNTYRIASLYALKVYSKYHYLRSRSQREEAKPMLVKLYAFVFRYSILHGDFH